MYYRILLLIVLVLVGVIVVIGTRQAVHAPGGRPDHYPNPTASVTR